MDAKRRSRTFRTSGRAAFRAKIGRPARSPHPMPSMSSVLRVFAVPFFLAIATAASAQWRPVRHETVHSSVLNEDRAIDVYEPDDLDDDPSARYETLYVLDGEWNGELVAQIVAFTRGVGFMPPVIVVSVPNFVDANGINSRDHDFTPTVSSEQERSGGAKDFLAFIKTELIPYVDAHHPTNGLRSIHGHSYGGLFLFYVLMNDPALFDGYLVLDPALRWDHRMFDALLEAKLPTLATDGKAIYVAGRAGRAFDGMGLAGVEPIFKAHAPKALHWNIVAYPDETHDSLKLKGTYDALKFVYAGYSNEDVAFVPAGGTLIRGKPFALHFPHRNDRLDAHYTTDGSTPDGDSPRIGDSLTIDDASMRIRALSNRGVYDREIPHHLRNGSAWRPARASTKPPEAAWRVAYYDAGAWPRFARAKPLRSETSALPPDFGQVGRDAFAGVVTRDLVVDADEYYVLGIESSEKGRLLVDGKVAVESDGDDDRRQASVVLPLARGTHTLRFEFQHADADSEADLTVFENRAASPEWWKNPVMRLSGEHH
jgi:predicted alpha/beta superfamily hydrolase